MKPNAYRFEIIFDSADVAAVEEIIERMTDAACGGRDPLGRETCTCAVSWAAHSEPVYLDDGGEVHR